MGIRFANKVSSRCKNCDIALKTIETQINQANTYKQNQLELQVNIETEVKFFYTLLFLF
jgi:hypothetical protein